MKTQAQQTVIDQAVEAAPAEYALCLERAIAAAQAIVSLPHLSEGGLPVIHRDNNEVTAIVEYWVGRANCAERLLARGDRDEICRRLGVQDFPVVLRYLTR